MLEKTRARSAEGSPAAPAGERWYSKSVLRSQDLPLLVPHFPGVTALGGHTPTCGLLQGTRKPSAPQKPLPAVPLSKTARLAHTPASAPGLESGLRLAPLRLVWDMPAVWGCDIRP